MPWALIHKLLGSGLHWGKSQLKIQRAIEEAEKRGDRRAAAHLRIILKRRNEVNFEKEFTFRKEEL